MTHDELLTRITIVGDTSIEEALRAVVELHKPTEIKYKWVEDGLGCLPCLTDYPCSTIQAIEKELNG